MTKLPQGASVLIDEPALGRRVRELAAAISADYAGHEVLAVGVLRGVVPFMADLLRAMTVPVTVDFLAIAGYSSSTASGVVRLLKDLDAPLEGRDVLLVEDVVDTGLTLRYILKTLHARRPASLRVCTLLDKRAHRLADLPLDYVGFDVPDVFVIGYGLDYQQRYRNLRLLAAYTPQ